MAVKTFEELLIKIPSLKHPDSKIEKHLASLIFHDKTLRGYLEIGKKDLKPVFRQICDTLKQSQG